MVTTKVNLPVAIYLILFKRLIAMIKKIKDVIIRFIICSNKFKLLYVFLISGT